MERWNKEYFLKLFVLKIIIFPKQIIFRKDKIKITFSNLNRKNISIGSWEGNEELLFFNNYSSIGFEFYFSTFFKVLF